MCWILPLKLPYWSPVLSVTKLKDRAFKDVTKVKENLRIRTQLNKTDVPIKARGHGDSHIWKALWESHLNATTYKSGRATSGKTNTAGSLTLDFLGFCYLSYPACGTLQQRPSESNVRCKNSSVHKQMHGCPKHGWTSKEHSSKFKGKIPTGIGYHTVRLASSRRMDTVWFYSVREQKSHKDRK